MSTIQYLLLYSSFANLKNISIHEASAIIYEAIKTFTETAELWSAERNRECQ
jgi:hypothetical protein